LRQGLTIKFRLALNSWSSVSTSQLSPSWELGLQTDTTTPCLFTNFSLPHCFCFLKTAACKGSSKSHSISWWFSANSALISVAKCLYLVPSSEREENASFFPTRSYHRFLVSSWIGADLGSDVWSSKLWLGGGDEARFYGRKHSCLGLPLYKQEL
jgi:hypothetical protein